MRVLGFNILGCLLEINQKETMNFFMTYGFFPRKTDSNERERMWHIYTLHLRARELKFSSSSFFAFALWA